MITTTKGVKMETMGAADVVVVGLGAAGSALSWQLARIGARVIGIDRFSPPHSYGSTHGESRISRQAVAEGPAYVPLVLRSHEIWREIESEVRTELLVQNGALTIASSRIRSNPHHGKPDFLGSTIARAEKYEIAHELLEAQEIGQRFPHFRLRGDERGYYEPGAGFVRPERCVAAQLLLAERCGATLHREKTVLQIVPTGTGVQVRTRDEAFAADKVVLTAGPWIPEFLPSRLRGLFAIHRQVLAWYEHASAVDHSPRSMPVFMWDTGSGGDDSWFYGFPALDNSHLIKLATEQFSEATTPATMRRDVDASETADLYERFISGRLPGVSRRCSRTSACLYTMTPDGDFVIDRHPEIDGAFVVSPCSGHGFKHSAALGEAVAELVLTGSSTIDLAPFRVSRPSLGL